MDNQNQKVSFKLDQAHFDGPLDLLLFLIQKSEINIYDIPIAQITDQFLDYMKNELVTDVDQMSDFYKMAADLLYIKSRMMLPSKFEFDEEYEDPRQELVQKLLDYQKFKRYSQLLFAADRQENLLINRDKIQFLLPFSDEELWEHVGVQELFSTFCTLMNNKIDEVTERVFNAYEEVTINEKKALMLELLEKHHEINFLEVVFKKHSNEHIVTAFLAILDSAREDMITLRQETHYGDIFISKKEQIEDQEDFDA